MAHSGHGSASRPRPGPATVFAAGRGRACAPARQPGHGLPSRRRNPDVGGPALGACLCAAQGPGPRLRPGPGRPRTALRRLRPRRGVRRLGGDHRQRQLPLPCQHRLPELPDPDTGVPQPGRRPARLRRLFQRAAVGARATGRAVAPGTGRADAGPGRRCATGPGRTGAGRRQHRPGRRTPARAPGRLPAGGRSGPPGPGHRHPHRPAGGTDAAAAAAGRRGRSAGQPTAGRRGGRRGAVPGADRHDRTAYRTGGGPPRRPGGRHPGHGRGAVALRQPFPPDQPAPGARDHPGGGGRRRARHDPAGPHPARPGRAHRLPDGAGQRPQQPGHEPDLRTGGACGIPRPPLPAGDGQRRPSRAVAQDRPGQRADRGRHTGLARAGRGHGRLQRRAGGRGLSALPRPGDGQQPALADDRRAVAATHRPVAPRLHRTGAAGPVHRPGRARHRRQPGPVRTGAAGPDVAGPGRHAAAPPGACDPEFRNAPDPAGQRQGRRARHRPEEGRHLPGGPRPALPGPAPRHRGAQQLRPLP